MPQTATPNMQLIQPTEGADANVWATYLTALFALIDQHDHSTGKGVKVPVASLSINADLPMSSAGTYYAVKDAKAIDFQPQAAAGMASYAGALFVNSADNELYWRTTSGTNVKLTSGSTLNVSLLGTIGGDYGAIGALIDYDDPTDTYRFRQQVATLVRQYARIAHSDVDLYEYAAAGVTPVPSNRVRLRSPAALAASYTVTFPAAVPASKVVVQMDSAGTLTSGGAVAMDALTITANQSVTVSGTGRYKHGTLTRIVGPIEVAMGNGGSAITYNGASSYASGSTFYMLAPITLDIGKRLREVRITAIVDVGTTVKYDIKKGDGTAASTIIGTSTTAGTGAVQTITITGLTASVASNAIYFLSMLITAGTGLVQFIKAEVDYDEP